jgi:hypothetical protein
MSIRKFMAISVLLGVAGCASNSRNDAAGARVHPGDSVRTRSDSSSAYRIRDTVPDTTSSGRRDTSAQLGPE